MAEQVSSNQNASFNDLSPAQDEALELVQEECAELIQIISKIQRHGLFSHHPDTGEQNLHLLHREIGDVMAALRIAEVQNLIHWGDVVTARDKKLYRVQKYLHHPKVTADE